jgi:hypothetical protein
MLNGDSAHRDIDAYARARILRCSVKVNKVNKNIIAATQQRAKSLILLRSVFA